MINKKNLRPFACLFTALFVCSCGGDDEAALGDDLERLPSVDTTGDAQAPVPATPPPGSAAAPASVGDTTPSREWTAGIVERAAPAIGPVVLRDVRSGRNEGYDRVVWEFRGERLPGYHIEYVDTPIRQCGSGEVTEIAGDGWLRVRLAPARAHTEEGEATITDREREPNLPVLAELELICDFEGQVEWVLGLRSPNPYRVLELRDPARLVIDVRQ